MNSRRKFLLQGSIASAALITYNPFKSVANTLLPMAGFSGQGNKVVFLHTGSARNNPTVTARQVNALKKDRSNVLALHAGDVTDRPAPQIRYDVVMPADHTEMTQENGYRIMYKGAIKIGIVYVVAGEREPIKRINALSARLKKEANCHIVVCLSQLGYKNKNGNDDIQLAEKSSHLDIVLSGHPENVSEFPFIAINSRNNEVIINSAAGNICDFGNIEIGFDNRGNKNSIAINNLRSQFV